MKSSNQLKSEICGECGHGFLQHYQGCSYKSPNDPIYPRDAEQVNKEMTSLKDDLNAKKESVNHPSHYGGDTVYETIKVIRAWGLDFWSGNAVKYISRAGKKDPSKELEDLKKARWYLDDKIKQLESEHN